MTKNKLIKITIKKLIMKIFSLQIIINLKVTDLIYLQTNIKMYRLHFIIKMKKLQIYFQIVVKIRHILINKEINLSL